MDTKHPDAGQIVDLVTLRDFLNSATDYKPGVYIPMRDVKISDHDLTRAMSWVRMIAE